MKKQIWISALGAVLAVTGILPAASPVDTYAADSENTVFINEIESDDPDGGNDWVEIINAGSTAVDISGWFVTDDKGLERLTEDKTWGIAEGTVLEAGAVLVLEDSIDFDFGLGKEDTVSLYDGSSAQMDSYTYAGHAAGTYSRVPDGTGNFVDQAATRGALNIVTEEPGDEEPGSGLVINEINSSPDDWVEIMNTGTEALDISGFEIRDNSDDHRWQFPAGTVMYVPALGTTETWGLLHNGDYAWFDFPYENEDIIGLDGSTTLKGISVQNSAGQWSPISVPSAGGYLALEPGVQYRATFSAVHTPTGRQIEYQPVFQADASSSGTEPAGFEAAYEWEGLLFSNRPVMPVTDWSKRTFPAGTVVFVPPKGGVSDYNDGFVRREASYGLCGENGEPTGNLADVPNNGLWLTLTPGASYVVHYLEMSTDTTDPSFTERMPYFTAAESTDQFLPEPDANGFVIGNKEQYLAYVQAHADDVFQVEAAVPDDAKILIQYAGTGGEVKIPQGVTFIGSGAFRMQEDVTRVTIPEGVTTIDSGAFYNCYQMKSVVIPESVNYIGSSAFAYCSGLTSVTIPSGLTQLKEDVFLNCSSLASVTIPASVTRIESGAFFYCGELDDVYFGGTEALWNAIDLTGVWDPRVQIHFGSVDQPEQPAQPVSDFSDVPASFWGSPYIQKAAQANLMTGTGNGTFEPNGNLTLAQAMVLAYQIHSQANGGSLPQTSGAWYMPYYQYCINHSLIAAGQFDSSQLNQTASRFDMVAILDKAIPADRMTAVTAVPDGAIPDLNEDDAYGDLVYRWYRAGIVTGDQKGQFNGTSSITRAETAVILCQINNLV